MSTISDAFVPSVGNDGLVGRFIGGCSGTFKVLCSGITTMVKCWSSLFGVYMYPTFDHGQHNHTDTTTEVSPDLGELAENIDDVSVEMIPLHCC